jgi:hypothetical protein
MLNWIRSAVVNWLRYKKPLPRTPLSDFERIRHEIKACDVLLVEGRSRVSEVIKLITQSNWSHAVLYIGRLHDIEDAQLRQRLGTYYHRALTSYEGEHIRICRPRGLGYSDSQKVISHAIGRLGTAYDVRQIFDLARFLFPWAIMPRRWRSTLFSARPGTSTQTVCSTMIAESFGSVQFPILPLVKRVEGDRVQLFMRNPKLCTPSDFDYSPYFDIIKYPFLDFHHHADQRLLPWKGAARLNAEEKGIYMDSDSNGSLLRDDTQ